MQSETYAERKDRLITTLMTNYKKEMHPHSELNRGAVAAAVHLTPIHLSIVSTLMDYRLQLLADLYFLICVSMIIYMDKLNLPYFTQDEEASILHYHAWFYLVSIYSPSRPLLLVYVV